MSLLFIVVVSYIYSERERERDLVPQSIAAVATFAAAAVEEKWILVRPT